MPVDSMNPMAKIREAVARMVTPFVAYNALDFDKPPVGFLPKEEIVRRMADSLMIFYRIYQASGLSIKDMFDELERHLLIKCLREFNGHQAKTAEFLGLKPTTLCAKMKKFKIVGAHSRWRESGQIL